VLRKQRHAPRVRERRPAGRQMVPAAWAAELDMQPCSGTQQTHRVDISNYRAAANKYIYRESASTANKQYIYKIYLVKIVFATFLLQ
jgi:hypothetical protein